MEQRGRPELAVSRLTFTERDPLSRGLFWPQHLKVALGYQDHIEQLPVDLAKPVTTIAAAPPRFILPNADGLGYGLFLLDPATRRYLLDHIEDIPDPLMRGSAWVDLWENFLEAKITPPEFLDLATRALPKEKDEQIRQRVLANLTQAFWRFLPPEQRSAQGACARSDAPRRHR